MKSDKNGGYKIFKRVLIVIGVVAALVLLHTIIFWLIPFIKELHGF